MRIVLTEQEKLELSNICELLSSNGNNFKLGLSLFISYKERLKDYKVHDINDDLGYLLPYHYQGISSSCRIFYLNEVYDFIEADHLSGPHFKGYIEAYIHNLCSLIKFIVNNQDKCLL